MPFCPGPLRTRPAHPRVKPSVLRLFGGHERKLLTLNPRYQRAKASSGSGSIPARTQRLYPCIWASHLAVLTQVSVCACAHPGWAPMLACAPLQGAVPRPRPEPRGRGRQSTALPRWPPASAVFPSGSSGRGCVFTRAMPPRLRRVCGRFCARPLFSANFYPALARAARRGAGRRPPLRPAQHSTHPSPARFEPAAGGRRSHGAIQRAPRGPWWARRLGRPARCMANSLTRRSTAPPVRAQRRRPRLRFSPAQLPHSALPRACDRGSRSPAARAFGPCGSRSSAQFLWKQTRTRPCWALL